MMVIGNFSLFPWLLLLRLVSGQQCESSYSIYGYEVKGHTIRESEAWDVVDCMSRCQSEFFCLSIAFRKTDRMCMLKNADRHTHRADFGPGSRGVQYMENMEPYNKRRVQTCADLKAARASAPNGYYRVTLASGRRLAVYCDMEDFGGGWTLVVGISSTDNNHLQRSKHNCMHEQLCVPFTNATITARKLSDADIHQLAETEGSFRVDYDFRYTGFFRIPSGYWNFDSSCSGTSCTRIIVSHKYPYVWESNCKGVSLGYKIQSTGSHRVFDCHDDGECGGGLWLSSRYHSERILYGYPGLSSTGLYKNKQGHLWVR
ncbi:uncharacterized protein LOC5510501 [Nematostella vectensis]|uniref:uncharacterized protein LOC5510501 n=1 Tax=Nematostella vectensis TaxID=45351 RepID=UPI0020775FCE|nr:uncharacterized protein LOC5510501 [Nematostella vectensis]XP_048587738.1 uncharacterized protein LOC5510501 [Nematostella vectensis]